jgi:hypothetical protein
MRRHGCRSPEDRALILPYLFGKTGESDSVRFEAHLLMCGACFADLKVLDRAGTILTELAQRGTVSEDRQVDALKTLERTVLRARAGK